MADLFVPPVDETFLLSLDAGSVPNWRLKDGSGNSRITREIRIVKGEVIQLLILADRECSLEIPAMRVRLATVPDRYQSGWFKAVETGEYEILVRSGEEQFDGKLLVTEKAL